MEIAKPSHCKGMTGEAKKTAEVIMTRISLMGPQTDTTSPEVVLIAKSAAN